MDNPTDNDMDSGDYSEYFRQKYGTHVCPECSIPFSPNHHSWHPIQEERCMHVKCRLCFICIDVCSQCSTISTALTSESELNPIAIVNGCVDAESCLTLEHNGNNNEGMTQTRNMSSMSLALATDFEGSTVDYGAIHALTAPIYSGNFLSHINSTNAGSLKRAHDEDDDALERYVRTKSTRVSTDNFETFSSHSNSPSSSFTSTLGKSTCRFFLQKREQKKNSAKVRVKFNANVRTAQTRGSKSKPSKKIVKTPEDLPVPSAKSLQSKNGRNASLVLSGSGNHNQVSAVSSAKSSKSVVVQNLPSPSLTLLRSKAIRTYGKARSSATNVSSSSNSLVGDSSSFSISAPNAPGLSSSADQGPTAGPSQVNGGGTASANDRGSGHEDEYKCKEQEGREKKKRNPVQISDHILVISGDPLRYECNICHKKFKTKAHSKYHEFCKTGEKPFKCEQCDQGFISKGHYEYHLRTHTGERPYTCPRPKCGKQFNQKGKLTRHSRSHTGGKPFVCEQEQCGRGFANAQSLKRHQLIHAGERPFPCEYCDKRFTGMGNLNKHILTHTGEKAFLCSHCGKTFGLKWTLDLHLMTHSTERPFACDQCTRAFASKKDLRRHMNIHTGEKPLKCPLCQTSFARKDHLDRHIKNTHKQPKEVANQLANAAAVEHLAEIKAKQKQSSKDLAKVQPESKASSSTRAPTPSTSSVIKKRKNLPKVQTRGLSSSADQGPTAGPSPKIESSCSMQLDQNENVKVDHETEMDPEDDELFWDIQKHSVNLVDENFFGMADQIYFMDKPYFKPSSVYTTSVLSPDEDLAHEDAKFPYSSPLPVTNSKEYEGCDKDFVKTRVTEFAEDTVKGIVETEVTDTESAENTVTNIVDTGVTQIAEDTVQEVGEKISISNNHRTVNEPKSIETFLSTHVVAAMTSLNTHRDEVSDTMDCNTNTSNASLEYTISNDPPTNTNINLVYSDSIDSEFEQPTMPRMEDSNLRIVYAQAAAQAEGIDENEETGGPTQVRLLFAEVLGYGGDGTGPLQLVYTATIPNQMIQSTDQNIYVLRPRYISMPPECMSQEKVQAMLAEQPPSYSDRLPFQSTTARSGATFSESFTDYPESSNLAELARKLPNLIPQKHLDQNQEFRQIGAAAALELYRNCEINCNPSTTEKYHMDMPGSSSDNSNSSNPSEGESPIQAEVKTYHESDGCSKVQQAIKTATALYVIGIMAENLSKLNYNEHQNEGSWSMRHFPNQAFSIVILFTTIITTIITIIITIVTTTYFCRI